LKSRVAEDVLAMFENCGALLLIDFATNGAAWIKILFESRPGRPGMGSISSRLEVLTAKGIEELSRQFNRELAAAHSYLALSVGALPQRKRLDWVR
jgi:hypothetical protein